MFFFCIQIYITSKHDKIQFGNMQRNHHHMYASLNSICAGDSFMIKRKQLKWINSLQIQKTHQQNILNSMWSKKSVTYIAWQLTVQFTATIMTMSVCAMSEMATIIVVTGKCKYTTGAVMNVYAERYCCC